MSEEVMTCEIHDPVILGNQNAITNSVFHDGVNVGDGSSIHNCIINGSIELNGNYSIVSGCMFYSGDAPGINVSPPRQNGVKLTGDNWPANAVAEINEGRSELQSRGYVGTEPMLVGNTQTIRYLDSLIGDTDITYRQFLMQNGLLSRIYEFDAPESDVVLIVIDETTGNIPTINREFFLNWRNITNDSTGYTKPWSKFSDDVVETAWKLLEEYMTPTQYFAFMEGSKIELENNAKTYRLILSKNGDFSVLEGKRGEGIVATSGRIKSYDYPLGDEIAAFLDWFKLKTEELISQWNCGTYGIVKEGQRR